MQQSSVFFLFPKVLPHQKQTTLVCGSLRKTLETTWSILSYSWQCRQTHIWHKPESRSGRRSFPLWAGKMTGRKGCKELRREAQKPVTCCLFVTICLTSKLQFLSVTGFKEIGFKMLRLRASCQITLMPNLMKKRPCGKGRHGPFCSGLWLTSGS